MALLSLIYSKKPPSKISRLGTFKLKRQKYYLKCGQLLYYYLEKECYSTNGQYPFVSVRAKFKLSGKTNKKIIDFELKEAVAHEL